MAPVNPAHRPSLAVSSAYRLTSAQSAPANLWQSNMVFATAGQIALTRSPMSSLGRVCASKATIWHLKAAKLVHIWYQAVNNVPRQTLTQVLLCTRRRALALGRTTCSVKNAYMEGLFSQAIVSSLCSARTARRCGRAAHTVARREVAVRGAFRLTFYPQRMRKCLARNVRSGWQGVSSAPIRKHVLSAGQVFSFEICNYNWF